MITLEIIKKTVEDIHNETFIEKIEDISVKSRKRPLPDLRFTYFNLCRYFIKELGNPSLALIGKAVDRDHASVLHGLKKFNHLYGSLDFKGNKIYFKCIKRISKANDSEDVENLNETEKLIDVYRVKHIALSEKYREVINKLNIKLLLYRKNNLVDKVANLDGKDLKELEIKLDAFFKVKESLNKVA